MDGQATIEDGVRWWECSDCLVRDEPPEEES